MGEERPTLALAKARLQAEEAQARAARGEPLDQLNGDPWNANIPAIQAMNTAVEKYHPGLFNNTSIWFESGTSYRSAPINSGWEETAPQSRW